MIIRQKEKYGWEFLSLGANIDAVREAARFCWKRLPEDLLEVLQRFEVHRTTK